MVVVVVVNLYVAFVFYASILVFINQIDKIQILDQDRNIFTDSHDLGETKNLQIRLFQELQSFILRNESYILIPLSVLWLLIGSYFMLNLLQDFDIQKQFYRFLFFIQTKNMLTNTTTSERHQRKKHKSKISDSDSPMLKRTGLKTAPPPNPKAPETRPPINPNKTI